jgi:hypothetical protein
MQDVVYIFKDLLEQGIFLIIILMIDKAKPDGHVANAVKLSAK